MPSTHFSVGAIIGSTLIALLLTGSTRTEATISAKAPALSGQMKELIAEANKAYTSGHYQEARDLFRSVALLAEKAGIPRTTAMNWNNAGGCSLVLMQYRDAFDAFGRARKAAELSRDPVPLASTLNNLANLYLNVGEPENALNIAGAALAGPARAADPVYRAKIRYQYAAALMELGHFDEADAHWRMSISELLDRMDFDTAARELGLIGARLLKGGRLAEAESALSEGLWLVRIHRLDAAGGILLGLADLKAAQGDTRSAALLYDAALRDATSFTPRWAILADRGQFKLNTGDLPGALEDFRAARLIAARMRADMVPADHDRVAFEGGLSAFMDGLVDAGNRLARQGGARAVLTETFDSAEQDRMWSLRTLVPVADDWRSGLPERYWELLAKYQSLERKAVAQISSVPDPNIEELRLELQKAEAAAAANSQDRPPSSAGDSPLTHAQRILDSGSVLFSFHVSKESSWIWAVDKTHVDVYPLPPAKDLKDQIEKFAALVQSGADSAPLGSLIYSELFGAVPQSYLRRGRWLLELDGPLYDLPFAALVTNGNGGPDYPPAYLVEQAALQAIPGALLMERGTIPITGGFLGVGDPVYNQADPRYTGIRKKAELTLPRLPNTSGELQAAARAWQSPDTRLLTGTGARMSEVLRSLKSGPAIVHFATHVVSSPGEFRSGLIALSLNPAGAMELLGPKEIVARPVTAGLVVMDGCHSSQADAVPSAGLMGLTRAWIGAGTKSVMATRWDMPDEEAQAFMAAFYAALRSSPESGASGALRTAQIAALRGRGTGAPARWAGYFLLSRI